MPAVEGIHVRGLRELNQAFSKADKDAKKFVRAALTDVARPVQIEAQRLAVTEISGLARENVAGTGQWALMRIGQTQKTVYVAPQQRSTQSRRNPALKRPKFGTLLMNKAMQPALEKNRHLIEARMEAALDQVADHFNH